MLHLIRLGIASPWIITFISRHPPLLDELLDPRTLYVPPSREELEEELRNRMDRLPLGDLEVQMEELCIFKQVNTLRVAAADVTEVLPLMRVSDHLSYIAETVVDEVLGLSWEHLEKKHGRPDCDLGDFSVERGFVVIAYGKLGGLELGYGSDLDLVFLHAGTKKPTQGGKSPVDSPQFFVRLGQRVLHILTAHTPAGILYEADMRLRPSGSSGLLVSHIDGFADYQLNEAWAWEHQALVRARPIVGSPALARRFESVRKKILCRPRDPEKLKEDVASMREKMRKERLKPGEDEFHLKQSPGGIIDIEFLVQYLVLLKAWEHPEIIRWTDNVRLLYSLHQAGVMGDRQTYLLREAYLTYRFMAHRLNLREKKAAVPSTRFSTLREKVIEIWQHFLGD